MHIDTGMTKKGKRFFEKTPVVDATAPLTIVVRAADIKKGVRHDPMSCAFATASSRLFGSTAAYFARTVAYVDFVDRDNVRRVHRFMLHDDARRMIKEFDATGQAQPAGYVLSPPSRCERLDYQAAQSREYRKTYVPPPRGRKETAKFNPTKNRDLVAVEAERDGRGQTPFKKIYDKDPE